MGDVSRHDLPLTAPACIRARDPVVRGRSVQVEMSVMADLALSSW